MKYSLVILSLFAILFLTACSDDDGSSLTTEEQQLNNLAGTWSVGTNGSITLNGNPAPGEWMNFSINFTRQKGVSVQGDPRDVVDIFSISTYDFDGGTATSFPLVFNGDTNERANVNINGDDLTMSFTLSEGDKLGARVLSVDGNWVFSLERIE